MKPARIRTAIGLLLLPAAVALIVVGIRHTHKVYEQDSEGFGVRPFHRVSDRELTVDATFSGVLRKGKDLYTTYDRSDTRGKRACPT